MALMFLTLEQVLAIHADQIQRYGGSTGLRDPGLLESAVSMPQLGFGGQYVHGDIYEMAAAYLFHITQNHAFIDGNKRVGAVAAFVFLRVNDYVLTASEDAYEMLVLSVAQGKKGKAAIAEFFRKHARPSR